MNDNKHNTLEGFLQILDLAYFMNKTSLRTIESKQAILDSLPALPDYDPIVLDHSADITQDTPVLNSEFVTGVFDGDGSINFAFRTERRRVVANFTVIQDCNDSIVLEGLRSYFCCGKVYNLSTKSSRFQVENVNNLIQFILP
jgi:hypothetical protein